MDKIVSVIIINRNREKDIENCLNSVVKQDYPLKEIIVVDNNSTDNSCNIIKKQFPKVILIKNKENVGACVARNQAIRKSTGKYVWFLDNDSVAIRKNILSSMVKIIKKEGVGAVGGESWIEDDIEKGFKIRVLLKNGESIWENIKIGDKLMKSDYLSTANFLVKKETLTKIGCFNPIYFYLYEDIDISYKIKKLGLHLVSNKDTLINHKEIQDSARITNFFRLNKNRIIFVILNFGFFHFLMLPILDIYYLFNPQKIKILKEKGKSSGGKSSNQQSFILKILKLGTEYFTGLFLAYLWVYVNLPKILISKKSMSFDR